MKRFLALLGCSTALFAPTLAAGQVDEYPVSTATSPYQPLPISGGGAVATVPVGTSDWVYEPVTLPFPVEFFGTSYTQVNVGHKGYITFGTTFGAGTITNQTLPSGTDPDNLFAAWWDDGQCPDGAVKTQVIGSAPTREFVIEWDECAQWGTAGASKTWSAQIWLTEGSPVLRAHYGTLNTSETYSATMGLENIDGSLAVVGPSAATGNSCGSSCDAADWAPNRIIRYGYTIDPDPTGSVSLGAMVATGNDLSFPVEFALRNLGMEPTSGVTWDIYLSTDSALDPTVDTLLTSHTNGESVDAQGAVTVFSDPVTMPRPANGEYWVCVHIDPDELVTDANRNNNKVCTPQPFLIGSDLYGSIAQPAVGAPGETIPFDVAISNQGSDATGSFEYKIFLSADETLDGYDTEVYRGSLSLQGTDSFSGTVNGFVPTHIQGNQFYAILQIDSADVVDEAIETNNIARSPEQITLVKPDLKVMEESIVIRTPGNDGCYFGEPMEVEYEICNIGGGNAWNFVTSVLLSSNYTINLPNGGDGDPEVDTSPIACPGGTDAECQGLGGQGVCYLGICHNPCTSDAECSDGLICAPDRDLPNRTTCQNHLVPEIESVEGNHCKTFTRSFVVPTVNAVTGLPFEEKPEGERYWLGVITDSTTTVNEENEGNNRGRYVQELNCRYPSSDMMAATIIPPARIAAGETASIFRTIANIGNVAGSARYRYLLSSNETISVNDIAMPLHSTGGDGEVLLERSSDNSRTDLVRVPSNVTPGEYYVGLITDVDGKLDELDELNNVVVTSNRIVVEPASMRIVTNFLPDGTIGSHYTRQLVATGGGGEYVWSADVLPAGFTLSESGLLQGTPMDDGVHAFEVRVTAGDAHDSAMLGLRINRPTGSLAIATSSLPPAVVGQDYFVRIAAVGGEPPYTCEEIAGSLPAGLDLNGDCTITGQPLASTTEPQAFTVEVKDAHANRASADLAIMVVEQADLFVTSQRFEEGTAGEPYDGCISASGGSGSDYTWTIDEITIPDGLAQEEDGSRVCLTGTPLECGTFSVAVRVEDGQGQSDMEELPLTIVCGRVGLLTRSLDPVQPGDAIDVQLEADAGEGGVFRLFSGRLPDGVTLDETGRLAGTVAQDAAVGVYNFVVEVSDGEGGYGLNALSLEVTPIPKELPKPAQKDDGGCSTAGGGGAGGLPFVVAIAALAAALRRRGEKGIPHRTFLG